MSVAASAGVVVLSAIDVRVRPQWSTFCWMSAWPRNRSSNIGGAIVAYLNHQLREFAERVGAGCVRLLNSAGAVVLNVAVSEGERLVEIEAFQFGTLVKRDQDRHLVDACGGEALLCVDSIRRTAGEIDNSNSVLTLETGDIGRQCGRDCSCADRRGRPRTAAR